MTIKYSQNSQLLHNLHIYPPKWRAGVKERGAELTFWVGGCEGVWR